MGSTHRITKIQGWPGGARNQRDVEAALDRAYYGLQLVQFQRLVHAQALLAKELAEPATLTNVLESRDIHFQSV